MFCLPQPCRVVVRFGLGRRPSGPIFSCSYIVQDFCDLLHFVADFRYDHYMQLNTPADLLAALKDLHTPINDQASIKEYRYVVYIRKSTDQEEKQVRSLADQILECKEYAERVGITIRDEDIVQEAESAKEPDIRPKFRKMIKDIQEKGKYDGILAWHPDRLARNMKDAGEIIDLLDKGTIKDLKFVSFSFEKTTAGKMLLGIMFVMSKEYSDKLSDDVSRGNKRSIEEGKYINKNKHGYFKDANQHMQPDGENFLLIKQAFRMRVEGKTMKEISEFLNTNHYMKWHTSKPRAIFKWNPQTIEKTLKDPSYTGIVMYGKSHRVAFVNLIDAYGFQPMISVSEFMQINKLTHEKQLFKLARKYRKGEDVKADLMRGMVICDGCGEAMTASITPKKTPHGVTRYFYYRCESEDCERKPRSIRAKVVLAHIFDFLDTHPFSTKEAYEHYAKEMERVAAERNRTAQQLSQTLRLERGRIEDHLITTKEYLIEEKDETIKKSYKSDVLRYEARIKELKGEIEKAQTVVARQKAAILTYENFLELMEKMPKILRSMQNMQEMDFLIRKIYTNFTIEGKNVAKSTLSAPFDALYTLKISNGGRGETRTPKPFGTRF